MNKEDNLVTQEEFEEMLEAAKSEQILAAYRKAMVDGVWFCE